MHFKEFLRTEYWSIHNFVPFYFQALLDLHGGQGSQNGFDNSGKRGEIHFQDGDNSERAVKVLGKMSALIKGWIDEGAIQAETIYGLELLNEPAAGLKWTLNTVFLDWT